ncbi:MAG: hypothetical protein SFT92_09415 [Rickettsiales bacterium]|jgi:hypothetical protein|nr:hypothetical protein [Rickettsiales bacterium]
MNKLTIALVAALTVATSHAAFAGGSSMHKQRIAQDNHEYFRAQGVKDSGQAVAQNPDYKFETTPAQRTAARSVAYFKDKPSSGTVAAGANKDDYKFLNNVTPAQRMANRSYNYSK